MEDSMITKKISWMRSITVIVLLACCSVHCYAQTSIYTLKGKVSDYETGKPIQGAKIIFTSSEKQAGTTFGTRSDKEGAFVCTRRNIPAGTVFVMRAYADGYMPESDEIITDKNETPVYIALKKRTDPSKLKKEYRNYKIRHRSPSQIAVLLRPYVNLPTVSEKLGLITAYGTSDELDKAEGIISEFDVPFKQIWLQVVLIEAFKNGSEKAAYPEDIKTYVSKLEKLFKFTSYSVSGRAEARGREDAVVQFSSNAVFRSSTIKTKFYVHTKLGYSGGIIHAENLRISDDEDIFSFSTSMNIKDGDTVILGATGNADGKYAVIAVIKARVCK